jgi:hypothetical protein
VKTPSGTHGNEGRSPGEDDGGGEDDQLRAMRSVWLAMRDEAPPDRGLADLLAAARGKAAALQPPRSRWNRLAALLRRPPMLALATAVVVLGGAALVARWTGETSDSSARMVTARVPAVAAAPEAMGWAAAQRDSKTGASPSEPGSAGPAPMPRASKPSPEATPDRKERPRPPPLSRAPTKSAADDDAIRGQPPDVLAAATAKPASAKHHREGDESLAALRSQCEAAASRGDCVTVSRLVERITKIAPSEGAQIVKQSRIATCLATDALRAK